MSRKVDPYDKSLSDEDKVYLIQRALMPEDVMSVEEQRKLVDSDGPSLEDRANTGTVNTANITTEQLEAELERRREAQVADPRTLMGSAPGPAADDEDEDDEPLEPPYSQYRKGQLSAEIQRRNETREEEDQLSLAGTLPELVARLEEDDAESSDEDEDED